MVEGEKIFNFYIMFSFDDFCCVKFNSYKNKHIDSLMTEISRQTFYVQENMQRIIDKEDYSLNSMRVISGGFLTLASLFKSNRNIYYQAETDFQFIGSTFLTSNNYTTPCYSEALFRDEKISENEVEYMKKIIEIVDKVLLNVYDEDKDTFNIDALNGNLQAVHKMLHDYENSPYLLIKI